MAKEKDTEHIQFNPVIRYYEEHLQGRRFAPPSPKMYKKPKKIAKRYIPLALKLASRYTIGKESSRHHEDAQQEALLALFVAAKIYDPSRGVSFQALATRCIMNALNNMNKHVNKSSVEVSTDTQTVERTIEESRSYWDTGISEILLEQSFVRAVSKLSSVERKILHLRATKRYDFNAIARMCNMSPRRVSRTIGRVRSRFESDGVFD